MKKRHNKDISINAAKATICTAVLTLGALFSLHFLSPEFDPSWRMVSEYANGHYSWVLSIMFGSWAVSSWLLAYTLRNQVSKRLGKIGLGFLILAGIGEMMAVFFDINQPLHGLAFLFGGVGLLVASLLISINLSKQKEWTAFKKPLLMSAQLPWISVVIMMVGMGLFISALTSAGVDMSQGKILQTLPAGVTPFVGWANRFLIIAYSAWVIITAWYALQLAKN